MEHIGALSRHMMLLIHEPASSQPPGCSLLGDLLCFPGDCCMLCSLCCAQWPLLGGWHNGEARPGVGC